MSVKKNIIVILFVVLVLIIVIKAIQFSKEYVTDSLKFSYPVVGKITGKFGDKRSTGVHNGIDIAAQGGTKILAPEKGIVTKIWSDSVNGNAVKILHNQFYSTGYAHLQKPSELKLGQTVKKGDLIGYVGSTGRSTGNHLHFTVKHYNTNIDPLTVINKEIS